MAEGSFAAGLVGITLDQRYRLDALLGEGGMGAVYRATQLANDRKVAVKLLKPHLTTDQGSLERFAREARATIKVESPHAVKVSDFGITPNGDYYMVLEYLDGRTVQKELDVDGPFEPRRVIHIAKQALHALGAAHAAGIVHRDIKPDNLLLMRVGDDPDYCKVLDFGVAKLLDPGMASITQAGMVFGTPEFMSPEQACGQPLDGRSDLYALAATMFAMLTGRGMYHAGTPIEWLMAHARQPAPHLPDGFSPELDAVLQQCFAKHKEQRPATADAMIALLDQLDAPAAAAPPEIKLQVPTEQPRTVFSQTTFTSAVVVVPPSRKGMWIALGGLVAAAMVVLAIVFATRGKPAKQPVAKPVTAPVDAAVVVAEIDAAPVLDAAPADAAVAVVPTRPHANPAVDQHIAAADQARQAGKWMKQIEEAHAALSLDPKNVKATLLLADGLIRENDIPTACKYLHALGKNPLAQAKAKSAGCIL
ncbi:MAG: protein kinase [Deltaproteobacteria bacterium]|nr:protein kinase [Deltaproteobacteria bacterium]